MIKLIMHGCNGKMGQVITKMVSEDSDVQIVAGIDPNNKFTNSYPVFKTPDECTIEADAIIDFSISHAVPAILTFAKQKKTPVVICTTGLNEKDIKLIHDTSKEIPVLFSANMSLGVNLLINLAKKATAILSPAHFDIEIIEKHHNQKIDAPSGTALAIANGINDVLNKSYHFQYNRTSERHIRPRDEIGIHAIRGGTIVGEHSILFAGQDEIIELKHSALSKDIFAVGAINAAKFISSVNTPGLYNMADLMD